jgi:murein DD-endopeptidase MepM/ murein hydrolase activator NlpD
MVHSLPCKIVNGGSNQKINIDNYFIRSVSNTGNCLVVTPKSVALVFKITDGSEINTAPCADQPKFKWTVDANGQIKSFQKSETGNFESLCIATENLGSIVSSKIIVKSCDKNEKTQKWELSKLTNISKRMSIQTPETFYNGDRAVLYDTIRDWHQAFWLESVTANTFRVRTTGGRCLDGSGNPSENAPVLIWDCHDGSNQMWSYSFDSREFKSVANPTMCLNVPFGSTANLNLLQLNTCNGSLSQQWIFNKNDQIIALRQKDQAKSLDWYGDGNRNSVLAGSHDGLTQQFKYIASSKQLQSVANSIYCVDAGQFITGSQVTMIGCDADRKGQKWNFDSKGRINLDGTGFCIEPQVGADAVGNYLVQIRVCNDNNVQKFTPMNPLALQGTGINTLYNFQISKTASFTQNTDTVDLGWQTSPKLQYPNGTTTGNQFSLEDGQKYYIRVRARDRVEGLTANVSAWQNYDPTTIDAKKPTVDNFSYTNQIFTPLSKQTPAQIAVAKPSNTTVTYDVQDKNFTEAKAFIYGKNYVNSYKQGDENTRILTVDGKVLSQIVFGNRLVQTFVENNTVQTRYSDTDTKTWSNYQVDNINATGTATMVVYNGKIYQFIRLSDSSLRYRTSDNGATWSVWTLFDGQLSTDLTAVVFNNKIIISALGVDGTPGNRNNYIRTMELVNGLPSFSAWINPGGILRDKVSMVIVGNRLVEYGVNSTNDTFSRFSYDGVTWSTWIFRGNDIRKQTTVINYKDMIVVSGVSADNQVYHKISEDGGFNFGPWIAQSILTDKSAGLQIVNNTLYQSAYETPSGKLKERFSTDGYNWSFWSEVGPTRTTSLVQPIADYKTDGVVKTISICKTNIPCIKSSATFLGAGTDAYRLSFDWDGKNDQGTVVSDGVYEIIVKAFDKAGNESINLSGNNFVVIDSTANATNISFPKNNGFSNTQTNQISGGLYTLPGGNNNIDTLQIKKNWVPTTAGSTNYPYKPVPLNQSSNFNLDTAGFGALDIGINSYTFLNTDKLGNTKEDNFSFFVEKAAPVITSVPQATTDSIFSFTVQDVRPTGITDDNQTSGMAIGINPGGYDISLIRLKEDKLTFDKEIPLFRDAQPVTDPTSGRKLADLITCTAPATYSNSRTGLVTCSFAVKGLTLDGNYKLYVKAEDIAGNQACTSLPTASQIDTTILCSSTVSNPATTFVNNTVTNIKTNFYYTLTSPSGDQTTKDNYTILQGKAERGQTYKVANTEQNRYIQLFVSPTLNGVKVTEYDLTTNLATAIQGSDTGRVLTPNAMNISCTGELVDTDNNPSTDSVEVCNYSYRMNLKGATLPATTQLNTITTSYPAQSLFTPVVRKITVNQSGINIGTTPNYTAFSPNGDGKFDTVSFATSVTDKDSGGAIIYPQGDYRATIKDSLGNTVWEEGNPGIYGTAINVIPTNITWNGKRNQNPTTTSPLNSVLIDGNYTFTLKVKLASGIEYISQAQSISIINQMTGNEKPVIQSPKTGYTTTKGIINIQGIAPQSSNAINGRTWKATICLDKLPVDNICDYTTKVATETTSPSFYSLLTVPQSTVKTEYSIKVTAEDNAGNISPASDLLIFAVEPNQNITTTAISNLTGSNTPEQILAFLEQKPTTIFSSLSGNTNAVIPTLNDLKTVRVNAEVSLGTEAVDIDLLASANPNSSLPISDPSYNAQPKRRLASITTEVEKTIPANSTNPLPPLNPLQDPSVKKNQKSNLLIPGQSNAYYSAKNLGYQAKCTPISPGYDQTLFAGQGGCKLSHNIILNTTENQDLTAGRYQVRTRSYKGESIAESFASFEITGITPVTPTILKIEKEVIKEDKNCYKPEYQTSTNCKVWDKVVTLSKLEGTTFYTNQDKLRVYGATDPDATVTFTLRDITPGSTSFNQIVLDSALISNEIMKANQAGIFSNIITIPTSLAPAIGNEKTYTIELTAGVGTAKSTNTFTLKIDKKTPTLTSVQTQTLTNSSGYNTNPWIRNGDLVSFATQTDEPTETIVYNELGFECTASRNNNIDPNLFGRDRTCDPEGVNNTNGTANQAPSNIGTTIDQFTGNTIDCSSYSNWELKNNLKWNGGTTKPTSNSVQAQSIIPVSTMGTNILGVSTNIPYPCHVKYLEATQQTATLTISKGGVNDGIYYPSIYLKDLAGNQTLISNNQQTQNYLTGLLKEIRPDSSRSYVGGITTTTNGVTTTTNTQNEIPLGTKKVIDADKIRALKATNDYNPNSKVSQCGVTANGQANQANQSTACTNALTPNTTSLTAEELAIYNTLPAYYPYNHQSRSVSNDFTLFIDNTNTDKGTLLLNSRALGVGLGDPNLQPGTWSDCNKLTNTNPKDTTNCDGKGAKANEILDPAKGITDIPEADRVLNSPTYFTTPNGGTTKPIYTTNGNTITFKTRIEKNQRVIMGYKYQTPSQSATQNNTEQYKQLEATDRLYTCTQQTTATTQNNIPAGTPIQDKLSTDYKLITKWNSLCDAQFSFTFPDDGKAETNLDTPANNYQFSFFSVDLAGNLSTGTSISKDPCTTSGTTTTCTNDLTISPTTTTPQNTRSQTITVYHDTKAPTLGACITSPAVLSGTGTSPACQTSMGVSPTAEGTGHSITSIQSSSYGNTATNQAPVPDQNQTNTTAITKDTTIKTIAITGSKTDTEHTILNQTQNRTNTGNTANPATIQTIYKDGKTRIFDTSNSNEVIQDINLGTQTRDDTNPSCTQTTDTGTGSNQLATQIGSLNNVQITDNTKQLQPIKNRKLGTCNDGLYTLNLTTWDTNGNQSATVQKVVERDTVSPVAPSLSLTAPGIKGEQVLSLAISGEAETKAIVAVFKGTTQTNIKNLEYTLDQTGSYNSSNLIGQLECDGDGTGNGVSYTVKVKLIDRATNQSTETTVAIVTLPCPRCDGVSTGGWTNPIHDYRRRPTSNYRTTERPGHNGSDMNVGQDANGNVIGGIPIYPAKPGTVEYSRYNYTDAERWTPDGNGDYLDTSNYVIINHNDGTKSHYVHLQYSANPIVTQGTTVDTNTILGYMGKTGQATDNHLHFGVFVNGTDVDPAQPSILNLNGGDATVTQQASWCRKVGEGELSQSQIDWQYANKTQPTIVINFEIDRSIFGNVYTNRKFRSIENATPEITRIVKETDYDLGVDTDIDGHRKNYKIFGYTPSTKTLVNVKVWDGNNLVDTFNSNTLNSATYTVRKNTIAIPDFDVQSNKAMTESNGRFELKVEKPDNGLSSFDGNTLTWDNEVWIDSKIGFSMNCGTGNCTLPNDYAESFKTIPGNRKTIQNNTERLLDTKTGIEKNIIVTGENSSIFGNTLAQDPNNKVAMLRSAFDRQKANYTSGNVWIVSHGWNGSITDTKKLAEIIATDNADDVALYVDWREISHTVTPFQSALWTEATSQKIKDRLNAWGFNDNTKLKLVGHSMGTILNGEIGNRFNKASYSMSLDNPSSLNSGYLVNTSGKIPTRFDQTATVSHAITGTFSPAGDMGFGETAHVPIALHYDNRQPLEGDWHGFVRDTYMAMQREDALQGDLLTTQDQSAKTNWNTFKQAGLLNTNPGYNVKGVLQMNQTDKTSRGEVGYLKYEIPVFGTQKAYQK